MRWNFAYGSNMHPDRLRGRANIEPLRIQRAVLRDWRLAFNLATGMSWIEPSMANVMPAPGEEVHGVALELTDSDLARLTDSEGGTRWYRSEPVEVETYGRKRLEATAFIAQASMVRDEVPPSHRYLSLIRTGARHHELAAPYRGFLEGHPAAPASRLSPWVWRFFGMLEQPRAHPARDAVMWLLEQSARAEARKAKR